MPVCPQNKRQPLAHIEHVQVDAILWRWCGPVKDRCKRGDQAKFATRPARRQQRPERRQQNGKDEESFRPRYMKAGDRQIGSLTYKPKHEADTVVRDVKRKVARRLQRSIQYQSEQAGRNCNEVEDG